MDSIDGWVVLWVLIFLKQVFCLQKICLIFSLLGFESRISAGPGNLWGRGGRASSLFQVQNFTSLYPIATNRCTHNN